MSNYTDALRYLDRLQNASEDFESLCLRCGACCGTHDGDPCANLEKGNNEYSCGIYSDRFGPRKTVKGEIFNCISIREIIRQGCLRPQCAYRGT